MKRSCILFVFLLSLPFASPFLSTPSSSNCNHSCGGIEIPYPFGIGGKHCYMNEWFQVTCNMTGTAFLPKINKEVVHVRLQESEEDWYGRVYIKHQVTSKGCSQQPVKHEALNLSGQGSPFFITGRNRLVSVGCEARALISGVESQITGCVSSCHQNKRSLDETCGGYKCCEATINPGEKIPQVMGIDLEMLGATNTCVVAFLTRDTYYPRDVANPLELYTKGFATMELGWYFDASISKNPGECLTASSEFSAHVETLGCVCDHGYMAKLNYTSCFCDDGFKGNPYIPGGCSDVNECQQEVSPCLKGRCVNNRGSYDCIPTKSEKIKEALLRGVVIVILVAFLLLLVFLSWRYLNKKRKISRRRTYFNKLLKEQFATLEGGHMGKIFSQKDIMKATNNLSENRVLGRGGQGTVYKGMLPDGKVVAIKISKALDQGKAAEFVNEMRLLLNVNHRHIVKLIGCCLELDFPVLVYEFETKGDLSDRIHGSSEDLNMTWDVRLRIAMEIAGALDYVHADAANPLYHRDVKTKNILLDDKYRAKLADFGASRSIDIDQTHVSTDVIGTHGYMDPEYYRTKQFNDKSDVYSFGVVLAELITGEKAVLVNQSGDSVGLVSHFLDAMKNRRLYDIIDPRIKQECKKKQVMGVANLTKRCLKRQRINRPTMRDVCRALDEITSSSSSLDILEDIVDDENEEAPELPGFDEWNINITAPAPQPNLSTNDIEPLLRLRTI